MHVGWLQVCRQTELIISVNNNFPMQYLSFGKYVNAV